ncbi:MAG: hypothetical protein ACYC9X_05310 [Dehalococcoidia bacterium]
MKWIALVCAVACAVAYALSSGTAFAQQARDPLIVPQEGGDGSRFQIVGQYGWTPGETVTIRLGWAAVDPLQYSGPFYHERTATVLRDGTWSFPIAVNDQLFPFPLGSEPKFIVVQAQSPTKTAINAFIYAPGGRLPQGADAIALLGFGPPRASSLALLVAALFLAATGGLIVVSGAGRRVA